MATLGEHEEEIDLGFDPSKEETKNFEIIKGWYLAKIANLTTLNTEGKTPALNLDFELFDAEEQDQRDSIGMRHFELFYRTDGAKWRIKTLLDSAYGEEYKETKIKTNDLVGRFLMIRLEAETYNGKERMRISRMRKADGWKGLQVEGDPLKKVGEKAAAKAAPTSKANGPTTAATKPASADKASDEVEI